jgi:hypothetical protein
VQDGYFGESDGLVFCNELATLCLQQYASFNSPVWFNVGLWHQYKLGDTGSAGNWWWNPVTRHAEEQTNQYEHPQCSACFIQRVEDNMPSIMALATSEARLFKFGSGSGTNLSSIRSKREFMSGGGRPSGPLSFLRIYDQVCNVVKSGGKCLAANQPVWTSTGLRTAKELAETGKDFICLSYDPPTHQIRVKNARAWLEGRKMVVRVTTDKGVFELSSDHPMRLSSNESVAAGALQPGMSLHAGSVDESEGYLRVHLQNGQKGKEFVHRMICEQLLGWDMCGLSTHHIDENKWNNVPSNLERKPQGEHARQHGKQAAILSKHPFQTIKYSHAGKFNGMHKDADFWKSPESVIYRETQRTVLVGSGRATEMQAESVKQKLCNTAFRVMNAGYPIETFEAYCRGRERTTGRIGDKRKVLSAIESAFGSYEAFVYELSVRNHRVIGVEFLGVQNVYDVEVECSTADDKSPASGHNFMLFSVGSTSPVDRKSVV